MSNLGQPKPRDRFIEKVGCILVAIPVGAVVILFTAQALKVPPAGLLLGVVLIAILASGSGSTAQRVVPRQGGPAQGEAHHRIRRRSGYEQIREVVERYESGEISAERRDALIREMRH